MKVKELIERLSNCDPEAEVLIPNSDAEEIDYHRVTAIEVHAYEECTAVDSRPQYLKDAHPNSFRPHLFIQLYLKDDPDREIEPGALPCVLLEREY